MSIPTFVDLQDFIVGETFVVKEFAVLSLYFRMPLFMGSSFKIRKILRFLLDCEASWVGRTG